MQNIFYYLFFFFIFIASILIIQHMQKKKQSITTQAMTLDQREEAKTFILKVAHTSWQLEQPFEQFAKDIIQSGEMSDLDNLQNDFFNNNGTFLVLMQGNKIIGTGGIKHIDKSISKLKHLFIHTDYQGRGLGTALLKKLITFAKNQGYKKVTLDVWQAEKQPVAMHLYEKFGFYRINSSSNNQSGKVIMEKKLNESD